MIQTRELLQQKDRSKTVFFLIKIDHCNHMILGF